MSMNFSVPKRWEPLQNLLDTLIWGQKEISHQVKCPQPTLQLSIAWDMLCFLLSFHHPQLLFNQSSSGAETQDTGDALSTFSSPTFLAIPYNCGLKSSATGFILHLLYHSLQPVLCVAAVLCVSLNWLSFPCKFFILETEPDDKRSLSSPYIPMYLQISSNMRLTR